MIAFLPFLRMLGSGLVRLVMFAVDHWRETAIVVLCILLVMQKHKTSVEHQALLDYQATIQQAHVDSIIQGATTGQQAVTNYVEKIQKDAPIVERVVTRLRNVCMRNDADHLPVSEGTGPAHDDPVGDGNDADRAFAEAAGRDLAACNTELTKLRELQVWVRANGG